MQKREIDILIMYLLMADGQFSFPGDLYKAARLLCLTEAKIRNLYKEVQLLYLQISEEDAKKALIKLIENKNFELRGNRIAFFIRDPMVSQWFQEWVTSIGGFTDSSFNANIITLSEELLLKLIDSLAIDELPTPPVSLGGSTNHTSRASKLNLFLNEFVKAAGKETGSASVKILTGYLSALLGIRL